MRRKKSSLSTLLLAAVLTMAGCGGSPYAKRTLLSAPPSASADNDIYVADAAGRILALRSDGKREWTFSLPDEIARLDAAASRDIRIDYLAARSGGKLFGLATEETGRSAGSTILFSTDGNHLLWKVLVPFPEQNGAPIAIGSDAVYEAGDDGALYAFARSDGHQLWKYQVSRGTLGAPTVGADGTIYVAGARNNLHAVSPDGTQRWAFETEH